LNLLKRDPDLIAKVFLRVAPDATQDAQIAARNHVDRLR
jgi:hypothetical protein